MITIKGAKDGLQVQIDQTADWDAILSALRTQFEHGGSSFFAGARLTLDIGNRRVDEQQLADVLQLMEHYGMRPGSLLTTEGDSRAVARAAGLVTRAASRQNNNTRNEHDAEDGMLLVRTVRSGQVIRYHGNVTLIGDVNPGAEVIAGGSVVVWGRLRGMVHAGALGRAEALICALELRPTQLRIASLIARTPDDGASSVPEVARVQGDHIIVEVWEAYRRTRADT